MPLVPSSVCTWNMTLISDEFIFQSRHLVQAIAQICGTGSAFTRWTPPCLLGPMSAEC